MIVNHGVPQFSVVGPIIFLVNTIDGLGDMVLFADNTSIYSRGRTPEVAVANGAAVFQEATDWFALN